MQIPIAVFGEADHDTMSRLSAAPPTRARLDSYDTPGYAAPDASSLQRAFAFACINNQQYTAEKLLAHGAQINQIAYSDLTGLHWAAYRDQPDMVRFLLEKGADPTIRDPNYDSTPLGWAIYHGNDAVRQILEEQSKDTQ
jgi:ankyrin repeat protein